MKLTALLETGTTGLWYGRIAELLGTHARASTRANVLDELQSELLYHSKWMMSHGDEPPRARNYEIVVGEEASGITQLGESGGEVALFRYDVRPVSKRLLDDCFRWMGNNRADLLDQVKDLPPQIMAHVPHGKKRNITQILGHVCNAEEFYLSRLGPEADQLYESSLDMSVKEVDALPIFDRLETVRHGCLETLRRLVPSKGDQVFTRAEYTSYPDERWTTHKVMRRFLEHEREHIYNIRDYLGVPQRGPHLSSSI
jgi:predicted RNase H-like HicB family nuclease